MEDVKNKMYNYETPPPDGVWESIAAELNTPGAKVVTMGKKKNKIFYYVAAAASVAVIISCVIFFTNRSTGSNEHFTTSNETKNDNGAKNNVIITVPTEERTTAKKNTEVKHKIQPKESDQNQTQNTETKNTDNVDKDAIASNTSTYITVEGPQGQPVKINSKMATLIDSTESKPSSKPIWNKKINEWREIMKANTLAPTPGNFLDIIELTKSVKDHK